MFLLMKKKIIFAVPSIWAWTSNLSQLMSFQKALTQRTTKVQTLFQIASKSLPTSLTNLFFLISLCKNVFEHNTYKKGNQRDIKHVWQLIVSLNYFRNAYCYHNFRMNQIPLYFFSVCIMILFMIYHLIEWNITFFIVRKSGKWK